MKKDDPGNYSPGSLASILIKTVEQIIKQSVYKHLEYNKVIWNRQHGLVKRKSSQSYFVFEKT